jgi:predicted permease
MVLKLNNLVFRVFLPVLIFNNVYTASIEDIKSVKSAIYAATVLVVSFLVCMALVPLLEKDNKKRGVMIQGMCRSNFVIYGIPLSLSLCGQAVMGKVSVAVTIVVPAINILSVIVLEMFRGRKPNVKKMLVGVLKNPLIIACLLGIAVLITQIRFPKIINTALNDVAKIATPLSLIVLGASINFGAVHNNLRQLIITLMGKLILVPLAGLSLAVLIGIPKEDIAVFIAVFASPTAVSSFTMAQQMDGDGDLAAQIVAFGTAISIVTVFFWVFILKELGWI